MTNDDIKRRYERAQSYLNHRVNTKPRRYDHLNGLKILTELDNLDYTPAQLALGIARTRSYDPNYQEAIRVLLVVKNKNIHYYSTKARAALLAIKKCIGEASYNNYLQAINARPSLSRPTKKSASLKAG